MAFMQNPIFQNNQQAMLVLQSHIQEHFAMQYRQEVERNDRQTFATRR